MRNFTDDEYFMVKLCHICDKANVPHHVVDDVVDLLRECKINNMHLQPDKLLKWEHFLKHLEKGFYSPIPQSVVVQLEGFSSNGILYSNNYRDSVEIIWYDFKDKAMDSINDVNIWGTLKTSKEQLILTIHFQANLLEKMDYLMKLLMEVGTKGHMKSARILLEMRIS